MVIDDVHSSKSSCTRELLKPLLITWTLHKRLLGAIFKHDTPVRSMTPADIAFQESGTRPFYGALICECNSIGAALTAKKPWSYADAVSIRHVMHDVVFPLTKHNRAMKKLIFLTLVTVLIAAGFTANSSGFKPEVYPPAEQAVLRVTSTTDSPITFEASYMGEFESSAGQVMSDGGRVKSQRTPFEMKVSPRNFQGVFHKTGGAGDMEVKVIGRKSGEAKWSLRADWKITMIVLKEDKRMTTGL